MQRMITEHPPLPFQRLQSLAERDPRRATRLARRLPQLSQPEQPAHAWALYTLGWALFCWERFDEAREHLRAARAAFARHDRQLAARACDLALLLADLFQRVSPELEGEFAALADDFEQAGAEPRATATRLYQAILLDALGRPNDAEQLLEQIAPAVSSAAPITAAQWLYIRGAVAVSQGDYARAEALLAQAEQRFGALRSPLGRARCWFQQGWAALRQERLDQALELYRRAERVFKWLDLPLRLALYGKGIGLLYARMGRYDDALGALLSALPLFVALRRVNDIAACQLNLGAIYFYAGLWEIALAYFSRAEALYDEAGVVSRRITARRNRAMIYRIQRRLSEASELLTEIEALARTVGDQAEIAEIWAEQAGLLAEAGLYEEATLQYQQAHGLFTQLDSQLDAAECMVEMGWLALQSGELEPACASFHSASPLVAAHPYYRWRTDYGLARCCEARGEPGAALAHYRDASATVAELRRRLLSEMASSGLYAQAEQLHHDSLQLAAASGALEEVLTFSEWQRALTLQRVLATNLAAPPASYQADLQLIQHQISALLAERQGEDEARTRALDAALLRYSDLLLRARHHAPAAPDIARVADLGAFDLERLRAELAQSFGDDWTALVYSLCDQTLLIGVVTPEGLALDQVTLDARLRRQIERASRVEYQIYTYRDFPYQRGLSARPWDSLCTLAERLLPAAARTRLHPQHRLLIVPAGPLHSLPWAALRLDDRWLAERAIIHLLPSFTVWQSLAARPPAPSRRALLVGCGTFGDRAPALPAITRELEAIAARWPGEHVRIADEQATRATLLERSASGELRGYDLLHIASHAQLLPTRGLAAHLKLWEGDLWLSEVVGLQLGGALVVLSACDGALAESFPGEEILSLSWAFLAAGASGVAASLWRVEDSSVCQLMALFYEALGQHGDAALALAQAQRGLIQRHSDAPDLATEPLAWGSFVFMGRSRLAL